jgi:hypothetical protein
VRFTLIFPAPGMPPRTPKKQCAAGRSALLAGTNSSDRTRSSWTLLASSGATVTWCAVALGLIGAAAMMPIGLLALRRAAVARGLAALRGAIGRFRAISGTARRRISRYRAGCDNQTTKGSQKQTFFIMNQPF